MFVEELKNEREWEDFLKITSGGTFYHSLKWKKVMERSFSHPTVYLVVRSESGKLVGICPTSIVTASHLRILNSLPHSDYGGPVIEKVYQKEALGELQRFIEEYCHEKDISCAKICFSKDGSERFFKSPEYYVVDNKGVVELDLRAKPSVFIWEKILRSSNRRKIKLFARNGFQVREVSTKSDLRMFLTLYYQSMRHIGELGRPYAFFENVWNLLYPENFNILLIERSKTVGREAVGGVSFFKYGETIYPTYLGIDRESMHSYSLAPFCIWNAIKWAEENAFRYVCLGSTPAYPKSAREITNYSQKVMFGGSFLQQKTVFIPFNFHALALLLFGSKAIKVWKAMRDVLPPKLQKTIERETGDLF
jgi:hypothetical protein